MKKNDLELIIKGLKQELNEKDNTIRELKSRNDELNHDIEMNNVIFDFNLCLMLQIKKLENGNEIIEKARKEYKFLTFASREKAIDELFGGK